MLCLLLVLQFSLSYRISFVPKPVTHTKSPVKKLNKNILDLFYVSMFHIYEKCLVFFCLSLPPPLSLKVSFQ